MSVTILGNPIALWCFNLRDNSKFKVLIGVENDIDDLKTAIKEKCKPLFDGFPIYMLKLWRVDTDQIPPPGDLLNT
jgi:hypothetical protein